MNSSNIKFDIKKKESAEYRDDDFKKLYGSENLSLLDNKMKNPFPNANSFIIGTTGGGKGHHPGDD